MTCCLAIRILGKQGLLPWGIEYSLKDDATQVQRAMLQ